MSKRLNLVGEKFGRLLVIEFAYIKNQRTCWLCKCNCGNEKIISAADLKSGRTNSCGCLKKELTSKRMKNKIVSEETRKKISKANKGKNNGDKNPAKRSEVRKKISESLKGKNNPMYGIRRFGKDNPNWIDGRTPEIRKLRNSDEIIRWRWKVFKRDNYTCQICGQHGYELQAHHIYPFSIYNFIRFELWNGITLCKDCHRSIKGKEIEVAKLFVEQNFNKAVD
jgi:hypothetical protein